MTNVFHPNDVIDTECVDRCSVLSIYPNIEVVIASTRVFVKDVFASFSALTYLYCYYLQS